MVRETDGEWHPFGARSPGVRSWPWQRIYDRRGPQNMAPFDVYGPDGTTESQIAVKQAFAASDDLQPAALNAEELLDRGRHDMAHMLLSKFKDWDRRYYGEKALSAARGYESTDAELERCEIALAVEGLLDERDRLYDIVMGFLHAIPNGFERWKRACDDLGDVRYSTHTPTDVMEAALHAELTGQQEGH